MFSSKMGFLTPFGVMICLICYALLLTNMVAYMSGMKINPSAFFAEYLAFILAFLRSNKVFKKTLCTQSFQVFCLKLKNFYKTVFPFKLVRL